MAVTRRRTRLVFFRVSEDEYRQFCELCESRGARSLSDLARMAITRMFEEGASPDRTSISADLQQIDRDVRTLKQTVGELVRAAGGCLPERMPVRAETGARPKAHAVEECAEGDGHAA